MTVWAVVKYGLAGLLALVLALAAYVLYLAYKSGLLKTPEYETEPPHVPSLDRKPAVLVFTKTNGFRHLGAIPASLRMFDRLAQEQGWSLFTTENAAVHTSELLARFDVVVWANASGDVLTPEQRAAFRTWVEGGGAWFGIHAAGGDFSYRWDWYVQELLRAQFIGHTLVPHMPDATIIVEAPEQAVMQGLPERWDRRDEWYAFAKSPRDRVTVLASIDEASYRPGRGARMKGGDHPMIWTHRVGQGTVLYSALGHAAASYTEANHVAFIQRSVTWLAAQNRYGAVTQP